MKTKQMRALGGAIGLAVWAATARAAGPGPAVGGQGGYTNHHGDANNAGWFTNLARWSNAPVPLTFSNQHQVVSLKPGPDREPPGPRPAGPLTPADVRALVQQFQQDRQAFMAGQQALEAQMKGLPEQDRQRLRGQLKDQMEQWKQQQARLREQLRLQCERMAEQLRDHSRLLDRVANPATAPGGPGGTGPRGRP